jgi:hypothetical protein
MLRGKKGAADGKVVDSRREDGRRPINKETALNVGQFCSDEAVVS